MHVYENLIHFFISLTGWFYPVKSKLDINNIPKHTRVESVAFSKCQRFLVITRLSAFTRSCEHTNSAIDTLKNRAQLVPHEIVAGEVLNKIGIVREAPTRHSITSLLLSDSKLSLR